MLSAYSAPAAEGPHVIRTLVHHQVTSVEKPFNAPWYVLSDQGNRILYALADATTLRLYMMNFDGSDAREIDSYPENHWPTSMDMTVDGSVVVTGSWTEPASSTATARRSARSSPSRRDCSTASPSPATADTSSSSKPATGT
jgi:hypothetical protein